jgi:hypothetical protein
VLAEEAEGAMQKNRIQTVDVAEASYPLPRVAPDLRTVTETRNGDPCEALQSHPLDLALAPEGRALDEGDK